MTDNKLKSAQSAKIGKRFKEKRLELSLDLQAISDLIVINCKYLQAIEDGNYAIFPSESFARAYFKKYKNFLKIGPDFPEIYKSKKNIKKTSLEKPFKNNFSLKLRIFKLSLLFIFFILVILFLKNKFLINPTSIDSSTVSVKELPKVLPLEDLIIIAKGDFENTLKLEFMQSSWLEIYSENKLLNAGYYQKGQIYNSKINAPFKINIGNADSVKGTYNGIEIDFITNANRLTGVTSIIFENEELD